MIEYHGNSGVVIDTQRFLGINTPIVGSNWGKGPKKLGNSNEALVLVLLLVLLVLVLVLLLLLLLLLLLVASSTTVQKFYSTMII